MLYNHKFTSTFLLLTNETLNLKPVCLIGLNSNEKGFSQRFILLIWLSWNPECHRSDCDLGDVRFFTFYSHISFTQCQWTMFMHAPTEVLFAQKPTVLAWKHQLFTLWRLNLQVSGYNVRHTERCVTTGMFDSQKQNQIPLTVDSNNMKVRI